MFDPLCCLVWQRAGLWPLADAVNGHVRHVRCRSLWLETGLSDRRAIVVAHLIQVWASLPVTASLLALWQSVQVSFKALAVARVPGQ